MTTYRSQRVLAERIVKSMERETLTVAEAARFLGIGKTTAYESVRAGRIPSVKFGVKYLIPKAALRAMLSGASAGAGAGDGSAAPGDE